MPRYKLIIEYDGTPFVGWQRQAAGYSIQGLIEDGIEKFSGERVGIRGAGRTDAGVHALAQVAHVDLTKAWEPYRVREALNYHLKPHPIAIIECDAVDDAFDARFSATQRQYVYRIVTRRAPPALLRDRVWWLTQSLDATVMHDVAQVFIGHHDFTTFRAQQCQAKSPVKTIDNFTVTRDGDSIDIRVSARSFLHNQVRSMVGALKRAGEGVMTVAEVRAALDARDRKACPPVAPSAGLYLAKVVYPPNRTAT